MLLHVKIYDPKFCKLHGLVTWFKYLAAIVFLRWAEQKHKGNNAIKNRQSKYKKEKLKCRTWHTSTYQLL